MVKMEQSRMLHFWEETGITHQAGCSHFTAGDPLGAHKEVVLLLADSQLKEKTHAFRALCFHPLHLNPWHPNLPLQSPCLPPTPKR